MTPPERFWSRVDKSAGPDACWLWTASLNRSGYGQFWIGTKNHRAHRLAWIEIRGPIPDGLVLDHLCRNRACVNPAHLEVVTHRENILRGVGPSAKHAVQTHCKRGHEFTPENTVPFKSANGRMRRGCRICLYRSQAEYRARLARKAVA